MAEKIEISVEIKNNVKSGLNNVRDDIKGFNERIKSDTAINLSINVAKIKTQLDDIKNRIKEARKSGDLKLEVELIAQEQRLKQQLTQAQRELRNFVRTGENDISVLGKLFAGVNDEIEKTRNELIKAGKSTKELDKIATALQEGKISAEQAKIELQNLNNTKFDKIINSIKGLGTAFVGLFALDKIKDFGLSIISLGSNLEQTTIAFTTMLGSAELAKKTLQDLTEFASKTPFEINGIRDTAKQLLAFGFKADELIPTLKILGDVSAGLSVPIEQIAYAYGQVRSANQLYGTELRQFVNAGVPLLGELAKMYGVTEAEAKKMVESGKVGFKDVEIAFQNMTSEGGTFFDLMEKQSKSVSGQWSNLKDAATKLGEKIGTALLPILQKGIDLLTGIIDFTIKFKDSIVNLGIAIVSIISAKVLLAFVGILGKLPGLFSAASLGAKGTAVSIGLLNGAIVRLATVANLALGPLGLLASAIALVVYQQRQLNIVNNQLNESQDNLNRIYDNAVDRRKKNISDLKKANEELLKSDTETARKQIEINNKRIEGEKKLLKANLVLMQDGNSTISNEERFQIQKEGVALIKEAEKMQKELGNTIKKESVESIKTINGLNTKLSELKTRLGDTEIGTDEFKKLTKEIGITEQELARFNKIGLGGGGGSNRTDQLKKQLEEEKRLEEERIRTRAKYLEQQQKQNDEANKNKLEGLKKLYEEVSLVFDKEIEASKKTIEKYQEQIDKLKNSIDDINTKLGELESGRAKTLGERNIEIDKELVKLRSEEIQDTEKINKLLEEKRLIEANATTAELEEAKRISELSPTARFLEEFEKKKIALEEERALKEQQISDLENQKLEEEAILQSFSDKKIQIDENYKNIVSKIEEQITDKTILEADKRISKLEELRQKAIQAAEAMRSAGISTNIPVGTNISGNTTSNTVNTNVGGIVINGATDPKAVAQEVKKVIINANKNANKGTY